MKKIILLILIFPLLLSAQTDTSLSVNGEITSINQIGINTLLSKYKNILKSIGGVKGWRIQVKFKAKREDILPFHIKFTNIYPEIPAHITFESPYYKLTVGNFRTRNEALRIKHKISKNFPGAHPVPMIIDSDLLRY